MKTVKKLKRKKAKLAVVSNQKKTVSSVPGQVEAMKIVDLHYTDDDIRHVLTAHAQETHGVFVPEGEWNFKLLNDDFTATAKLSGNVTPRDDDRDVKGTDDEERWGGDPDDEET